jgi:hypothetical protein
LDVKNPMFIEKEDKFTQNKEDYLVKRIIFKKSREELINDKFIDKIRTIFFDKYSLLLKKLDMQTFELNGHVYLFDVKDIVFEKFDIKDIKIKSEKKLTTFRQHHQFKNLKIDKESLHLRQKYQLFNGMLDVYEKSKKFYKLDKYLNIPAKDDTTDKTFKLLRPNCQFTYSELISDKVSKKEFGENASINLWNI